MLIVNTQPTYPPTGAGPYLIDRTWCLGDSLPYLNGNTNIFTNSINGLQTTIASTSGNLLSLINTLSSNMSQIGNFPYVRAEVLASNPGLALGMPSFTTTLALNNIRTNYGFASAPTLNSGGLSLPSGTFRFKWTSSPIYSAQYQTTHLGQWSLLNRSNSNAILAQSPETYFDAGTNYIADEGPLPTSFEGNFTNASSLIVDIQLYVSSYIHSWNNTNGSLTLLSRQTNSPVGILEVWKLA